MELFSNGTKFGQKKSYLRGKVSRMVAGKISICAKVDFYKGQFIGDKIAEEIDKKIELIKKSYPNPPERANDRIQNDRMVPNMAEDRHTDQVVLEVGLMVHPEVDLVVEDREVPKWTKRCWWKRTIFQKK